MIMSIYILDFTVGESYEYSDEKYNELKAFDHNITLCSITSRNDKMVAEDIEIKMIDKIKSELN